MTVSSNDVRSRFLDFFREREHQIVPSASVVPLDDPTLLFTNAGMNQFKPYFLELQKPPHHRIADSQKCIRVSGKHNDLEEVGSSPYHHTFFEMLGNWSIGDYFKKEAIAWAWELMTQGYGLPKDKLYATVYETDDEADRLWKSETDIPPDHVLRFGKKDNWWSMGDTGPSGPCSELHIDRGPEFDSDPKAFVNTGSPRYIELWNLVFIQFDTQKDGSHVPLPNKHVDTGAGLERITAVMNGVRSNYDTDLFLPIIEEIAGVSGLPYSDGSDGIPHRAIADHVRCLTFALADGAMPGSEGRGHVLRSILRRAARFGRKLDVHEPFVYKLVPAVIDMMGGQYPEIRERHVHISRVIEAEETNFGKTLGRGLEEFERVVEQVKSGAAKMIPGEDAFRLYDTFGFHLDLTQQMARENELDVDVEGFEREMEGQRQRARAAGGFQQDSLDRLVVENAGTTKFVGYNQLEIETNSRAARWSDDTALVAPEKTPFYAESGGQVSDSGTAELVFEGETLVFDVIAVEHSDEAILHRLKPVGEQQKRIEDLASIDFNRLFFGKLILKVNPDHRTPTQHNHTATHLLQAALQQTLGDHVHQKGSLVAPDHFRFDYTHFEKPSDSELAEIERQVNEWIHQDYPVTPSMVELKKAQELGAMALFGEKYEDEVRMLEIGEGDGVISRELCGGCHVKHTGEIGMFVIQSESSVAAGVRRIEGLTGETARRYLVDRLEGNLKSLADLRSELTSLLSELEKSGSEVRTGEISPTDSDDVIPDSLRADPLSEEIRVELVNRVHRTTETIAELEEHKRMLLKELERVKSRAASSAMTDLASKAETVGSIRLLAAEVQAESMDQLKEMGDVIREQIGSGVGVLATVMNGKPSLVVVVTPDLVKSGVDAVPIVKELGKRLQGGGGGKPHLATAGGKNAAGIPRAVADARSVIESTVPEAKA